MFRTRHRLVPVPGVKSSLPATSLIFGKLDRVSNPAQPLDRGHRHYRNTRRVNGKTYASKVTTIPTKAASAMLWKNT